MSKQKSKLKAKAITFKPPVNCCAVFKICTNCNKEFEIKLVETSLEWVATFENCTHCGTRNDIWLRLKKG